jgi:hypothetical protein
MLKKPTDQCRVFFFLVRAWRGWMVAEPNKKKDPDAEVVALSPATLMATNRFVCEICGKGFQRDQNLQLHRRGHNLPWKLKQRGTGKEAQRKKVYVCPEASCVHHDPARALGDLTGIKKHFFRKHGEKKWKCDKCSKKYAVHSDWKAHSKICGTREYKCDCGTIFSRSGVRSTSFSLYLSADLAFSLLDRYYGSSCTTNQEIPWPRSRLLHIMCVLTASDSRSSSYYGSVLADSCG